MKTLDAQAGIELAHEEWLILPRNKNPSSVTHQLDVDLLIFLIISYMGINQTMKWMKLETSCSEACLD